MTIQNVRTANYFLKTQIKSGTNSDPLLNHRQFRIEGKQEPLQSRLYDILRLQRHSGNPGV